MKWNKEEEKLIENFYNEGKSIDYISLVLNRSKTSVQIKAQRIGVKHSKYWTDSEDKILLDNYQTCDINELTRLIKSKTKLQVSKRMSTLNIRAATSKKSFYNLNDAFNYYKKYINGEYKKFSFDYPNEYDTIFFRYFIKLKNIKVTEEFLYNIFYSEFLKEAKLYSRIKKKWHSCYEFITNCYPNFNLKEYKFKTLQVREGFWNNNSNCFDCISNGIEKAIRDDVIDEPLDLLSLDLDVLYNYIHKSMIYFRNYAILYKYFDYIDLDYTNALWLDKMKFDSKEEKYLYKHLKYDLNLDICKYRGKKLLNIKHKEKYIPDFIWNLNGIKFYIEYFGMYKDNAYNDVYRAYQIKTNNKIDFYNHESEIKCFFIYPEDIRSNFIILDQKIVEFKKVAA